MKQHFIRHLGMAVLVTVCVSCADGLLVDEPEVVPRSMSDRICFIVEESSPHGNRSDGCRRGGAFITDITGADSLYLYMAVSDIQPVKNSRATHITTDDYALRISCVRRRESNVYDYYFANTQYTKNNEGVWVSDPEYLWLDANTSFKFYGYAPAVIQGATFIRDTETWEPKVDYTVPVNVTSQTDLLYSEPMARDSWIIATPRPAVSLKMRHTLACIGFKTGKDMAAGTINKVTIRNAVEQGTLNLADGSWTLNNNALTDFYADFGLASSDRAELTADAAQTYFMLLPGSNIDATTVEIDFTAANGTNTVYTGRLVGDWEAGKQYMYNITINPDLDITVTPETQDAHYVISKAHVSGANMQDGQQWTLTATADDGADVTLSTELNEFQQQGYWIDEIREPGKAPVPARGTSTLTGQGDRDVYIFLPENAGRNNRTITLKLTFSGSDKVFAERTFEQVCPAWVDTFGWEQMDESRAYQYGFNWARIAYYGYTYNFRAGQRAYISSIITDNNAGNYANIDTFWGRTGLRFMIVIDYTKLSNLSGQADSHEDGWSNTRQLYALGGTGAIGSFESTVANIYKTEVGHLNEKAFRLGDGTYGEPPAPKGENKVLTPAAGACLLKNRWYLIKTVSDEGDVGYVPLIEEKDIVWYLPAVEQFNTLPANVIDPIDKSLYWSSTAGTTNTQAYMGNNTQAERLSEHKIRACRKVN